MSITQMRGQAFLFLNLGVYKIYFGTYICIYVNMYLDYLYTVLFIYKVDAAIQVLNT